MNTPIHPPDAFGAWWAAARPWSLPVAISPVAVGAVLAWQRTGQVNLLTALMVLAAAVLMQLVTNLQNDVGFTLRRGADAGHHTGPPRATAEGWLSVRQVRMAVLGLSMLSALLGLVLVARCGWPVLVIGSASLLAALAYMGGPWPVAYTPLGELTVFLFFGALAVSGTEWALTGSVGALGGLASLCLGALAAAVLAVNNQRDIAHDRRAGRRTFAVVFGVAASHGLYTALVAMPFLLLLPMAALARSAWLLLPELLLPWAMGLVLDFRAAAAADAGPVYNALLRRTFRLELIYAALLCAGAVLGATHA